jgi:hypothetical protein
MSAAANKALDSRLIRAVVRPIWRLALARDLIIVELYSAWTAMLSFGIIPILAGDTLTRAPAYHVLLVIMQALFGGEASRGCGALFILGGAFQATGYLFGWHTWRMVAALGAAVTWSFVGSMLVWADWRTTGWTYILLGLFMMWVRIRLSLRQ